MNILQEPLRADQLGTNRLVVQLTVKGGMITDARELAYIDTVGSSHFYRDVAEGGEVIVPDSELTSGNPSVVLVPKLMYNAWATTGAFPKPVENASEDGDAKEQDLPA